MNRLLVIGGMSLDVLHLADRTVTCAGGAGMYTAMAARRCGARVAMFCPRHETYPEQLETVIERLDEWLGPVVPEEQLPRFEISYRQGKTEYLKMSHGAQAMLTPDMLPGDLSTYDHAHVIPLASTSQQLAFMRACLQRGVKQVSAGTFPVVVEKEPEAVRAVMAQADLFFMNEREAGALFGSLESAKTEPGKLLYVTLGAEGALVIQGDFATRIPAVPATELDPTGAGDTLCGATLAFLLQKQHPIMAARRAVVLAAEMIGQVGPTALLSEEPPPEAPLGTRVRVNTGQVQSVASKISTLSEMSPYPFVSPELPPTGHPKALDYFFAATLQQFSFWTVRDGRYEKPLIARIGGVDQKGSDYLWDTLTRRLMQAPDFCSPERQANLTREELRAVFCSDDGQDVMPALDLHLQQAHAYGRDMLALQLTPEAVVQEARSSGEPLQTFLVTLDKVGGYKEDPLRKKSLLLAMILDLRPERFFPLHGDEQLMPVMDYHLMRSCLRVGLIDILDGDLRTRLSNRQVVSAAEEWAIRYPAYLAMAQVEALSNRSKGEVDLFFFRARQRCPEMTEPECQLCPLDPVCGHRRELFQPVLRTAFY